jgi:serine/threonine protein kinase
MLKNNGYVGKYIGGYHISLELASSSSSRIFLGESVSPDRHNVAIKRIYAVNIRSWEDEERFLQEANVLKQLSHPYILPLRFAYVLKGTPYVINEYAPGGTLHDRLQRQGSEPMTQEDATTILSQIGQALQYAHQKNIIHGNLKPQNILFNGKGDALLADFKFTSLDGPAAASPAELVYMSREQIEGINSKENDQYSLGCIAYEMFTGRKPFTTPSIKQPGTYYKTRVLIAPTKLNPALPARIEQAILKAMARDPSQRYQNVMEFIKALGTPGILIVPDDPFLGAGGNASQKNVNFLPRFPGLKVATAGATTLAQFTAKAALLRNTFTSIAGFSTLPPPDGRRVIPFPAFRKSKVLRPLLIIASLLLITALIIGVTFALAPSHQHQASTDTGTTIPTMQHQKATPGRTKIGNPQSTPTRTHSGITVPVQPTQPVPTQPVPPAKPSPVSTPTPQPVATTAPPKTTALTIAPTILNGENCGHSNGSSICTVTLSLGAAAASSQSWYTYSIGVGANFSPSSGTIAPGQALNIQITVFDTCTKTGTFVFVGSTTNVTATWNC